MITVRVIDGLTPLLSRVSAKLTNTQGLMRVAGGELAQRLKTYWYGRGQSIYTRIARDTALAEVTPTSATVTVGATEGMGPILLHKRDGGTVYAKDGVKYLAIPATDAARRLGSPREWSTPGDGQLVPVFGRGGHVVALARGDTLAKHNKRKAAGSWKGAVMYWLRESVYHRPDPQAMPDWSQIETAVADRVRKEFSEQLKS